MRDGLIIFGVPLGAIAAVTGLLFLLANWGSSVSCANTADVMGLEHRYGITTDCMVKVDGRWEPLDWQRSVRIKGDK